MNKLIDKVRKLYYPLGYFYPVNEQFKNGWLPYWTTRYTKIKRNMKPNTPAMALNYLWQISCWIEKRKSWKRLSNQLTKQEYNRIFGENISLIKRLKCVYDAAKTYE